jgi:hypothetical protein
MILSATTKEKHNEQRSHQLTHRSKDHSNRPAHLGAQPPRYEHLPDLWRQGHAPHPGLGCTPRQSLNIPLLTTKENAMSNNTESTSNVEVKNFGLQGWAGVVNGKVVTCRFRTEAQARAAVRSAAVTAENCS